MYYYKEPHLYKIFLYSHSKHAHPNHDIRIEKKVSSGELFPSMKSAEEFVKTQKVTNSKREKRKKSPI